MMHAARHRRGEDFASQRVFRRGLSGDFPTLLNENLAVAA
jgi:hypothetical protein